MFGETKSESVELSLIRRGKYPLLLASVSETGDAFHLPACNETNFPVTVQTVWETNAPNSVLGW